MYDKIFRIWLNEREQAEITKLNPTFLSKVKAYLSNLNNLKDSSNVQEGLARTLVQEELTVVSQLMEDLMTLRRNKVIQMVLTAQTIDTNLLTQNEFKLYNRLKEELQHNLEATIQKYEPHKKSSPEGSSVDEPMNLTLIRIKQDGPASMGSDLKTYGPFKNEDIIHFPTENAQVKLKNDQATEIILPKMK